MLHEPAISLPRDTLHGARHQSYLTVKFFFSFFFVPPPIASLPKRTPAIPSHRPATNIMGTTIMEQHTMVINTNINNNNEHHRHQRHPTHKSLSVMYSWTSLFLQAGDSAMFNLSILTSDVYAIVFAFFVEHVTPNWLFFAAFAVIFCGLVFYHAQPAPTRAELAPLEIFSDGTFQMGSTAGLGGGLWPEEDLDCHRSSFFSKRGTSGNSGNSDSTYCGSGGSPSDSSETGNISPSPNTTQWFM